MTTRLVHDVASDSARGASEFSDHTAVLLDEERGGGFVKRRPGVCAGLLCTTKGVGCHGPTFDLVFLLSVVC